MITHKQVITIHNPYMHVLTVAAGYSLLFTPPVTAQTFSFSIYTNNHYFLLLHMTLFWPIIEICFISYRYICVIYGKSCHNEKIYKWCWFSVIVVFHVWFYKNSQTYTLQTCLAAIRIYLENVWYKLHFSNFDAY